MTRRTALLAGVIAAFLVAPVVLADYYITLLNYVGIGTIVAAGLVLMTGIGGITSFGQAAFAGIGAYATALVTINAGLSPWIGLAVGVALAGAAACVIGLVTLRLSGHFLPLSTIAWSLSLYFLAGNLAVLGGHNGLTGLPAVDVAGITLASANRYYYLIWTAAGISLLSVHNLLASRIGRAIRCLRGRSRMAEAFGVDTARLKIIVFVYAALLAAVAGWLYAHLVRFVNPTPFNLNASIDYLFMAVLGGASSVWGALVGAAVLTVLRDRLQDLMPSLVGTGGAVEIVVFGLLVLLILQRARLGITGWLARYFPSAAAAGIKPSMPDAQADTLARRPRNAQAAAGSDGLLDVRGVSRRFGGLSAVRDVSFNVRAAEILGLIGPNGAGKSTLFNMMTGVLPVSEGEILFAGQRIQDRPSREIARCGLARSFQHVRLTPDMSCLENVAMGGYLRASEGAIRSILRLDRRSEAALFAEAARALDRVGLAGVGQMPAGAISLGQQRLVEVARALAADPVLLLLDEPAAGLRWSEKETLADLLRQLRSEGLGIVLVEHDMDFVMRLVDRLIVLNLGHKIAEGAPADVQANPIVRDAYLGGIA